MKVVRSFLSKIRPGRSLNDKVQASFEVFIDFLKLLKPFR